MGKRLAAWISTLPSGHDYCVYLEQIAEVYGGLNDFETVLADLMACPLGSPAATLGKTRLQYVLNGLKEAVRDHFDLIRAGPVQVYHKLARIVRPGDSVITFNYDLGVEGALRRAGRWDIRTGYGFSIDLCEQASPVEVLKLHGSTNWRALLFGGRTKGSFGANGGSLGDRPVLFFRPDLEYLGYPDFVDPLCANLDSAPSLSAMILPALPKRFCFETSFGEEWKPFWDGLWRRAQSAVDQS